MFCPSGLQKLFPSFVQLNPFADIPSDVHLPPIKIKALSQQIYLALKKKYSLGLHVSVHNIPSYQ